VLDGALVAWLLRLPHVWHLRETVATNTDLRFPCPVSWLPDFILRTSSVAIVNSHDLGEQLFGSVRGEKIRVVHNGIDLQARDRDNPVRRLALPVPKTARLTAICGRLTARKGVDVYLRAMAHLKDSHPDLQHLVIGEGSQAFTRQLMELAQQLGLQDRVHFLGQRQDVRALFGMVDLVISSSVREPFGRTLLEAMACGVPVVATRSGGPEEILVDGDNGFLVEVGDAAAIAERVARLLDDQTLAQQIGLAGRETVEAQFQLADTVNGVVESFEQALRRVNKPG
jgi:glycosyltransferase involved in cell wall biosynthesis